MTCDANSVCQFENDTVEHTVDGAAVSFTQSHGVLNNCVIRDAADWGMYLSTSNLRAVNLSITNVRGGSSEPAGIGIAMDGSDLTASNLTIQNTGGSGIYAFKKSFLQTNGSSVNGNGGWGIAVLFGSTGSLAGSTVNNNVATGVFIDDASSVVFGGGTYLNNGGGDIFCGHQSAAARFIETTQYGSTNCPVPAPDI